jgi:hypothetical protein
LETLALKWSQIYLLKLSLVDAFSFELYILRFILFIVLYPTDANNGCEILRLKNLLWYYYENGVKRGLRGRDDEGNVNNEQYKFNQNCCYDSSPV